MTISLKVPAEYDPRFFEQLILSLNRNENDLLKANTANRSVLLYSPGKKVYEVKVDDAGVITATLVSG